MHLEGKEWTALIPALVAWGDLRVRTQLPWEASLAGTAFAACVQVTLQGTTEPVACWCGGGKAAGGGRGWKRPQGPCQKTGQWHVHQPAKSKWPANVRKRYLASRNQGSAHSVNNGVLFFTCQIGRNENKMVPSVESAGHLVWGHIWRTPAGRTMPVSPPSILGICVSSRTHTQRKHWPKDLR